MFQKAILFILMASTLLLVSCQKSEQSNIGLEDTTSKEQYLPISMENDLLTNFENFSQNLINNRNAINAYHENASDELLLDNVLKDCGFLNQNLTIEDLNSVFTVKFEEYKASKALLGVNIKNNQELEEALLSDLTSSTIINRSPCGECTSQYLVQTAVCFAIGFSGPWGPPLAYTCQAANIYNLAQCADTHGC